MGRICLVLFITTLGCLPVASQARVLWLCGLSDDGIRLVCVADPGVTDTGPASHEAITIARPPRVAPVVVHGTHFPLDPARSYTVDLWSPPSDAAFVQLLAQSSICHRSPDCETLVAPSPWLAQRDGATARSSAKGWR